MNLAKYLLNNGLFFLTIFALVQLRGVFLDIFSGTFTPSLLIHLYKQQKETPPFISHTLIGR